MEADTFAGLHMDEEDGVIALVSHGLRVRIDDPRPLDGVGDNEDHLAIGDVSQLEGLFDDADVPAEELMVVDALFAVLAGVLAIDVADGTVAIWLLF
jgi:hypothetical protein